MSPVQWLVDQVNADCTNSVFIQQHLVNQALEMENQKMFKGSELETFEISDEEIEKAAIVYADKMYDKSVLNDEWEVVKYDFMEACKWYREQLKKVK
jgi:hypothetical protein